jgi:hypothetical protein
MIRKMDIERDEERKGLKGRGLWEIYNRGYA